MSTRLIASSSSNIFHEGGLLPYNYFDLLRTNHPNVLSVLTSNTSNIHQVQVNTTTTTTTTYRLADISCFLPLTQNGQWRSGQQNDAFAAVLAVANFNSNLEKARTKSCNVRLTMELWDTEFNPISATRTFSQLLQRRRNASIENPLPASVVGAYRSATTSPLAILSGVNELLQVSYASSSADFEVVEQYPYFGRTCSSSWGESHVSMELFQQFGYHNVGILFITDSYGSAFQKAIQDAAANNNNMTITSVAFSYAADRDGDELSQALLTLKEKENRIIFAICFENQYVEIMRHALQQNMVGPDYVWIFPGFQKETFQALAVFEQDDDLVQATRGIALMEVSGGLVPQPILPGVQNQQEFPIPNASSLSAYDKFRQQWRNAIDNPQLVEYFATKLPPKKFALQQNDTVLSREPSTYSALVYDAIMALGKCMCESTNSTSGEPMQFFTGKELYRVFQNLDFEGASGQVRIDNDTGTRDFTTLTFTLWNVQEYENRTTTDGDKVQFQLVPTHYYTNEGWQTTQHPFIFNDGTTTSPPDLPPPTLDYNLIGTAGQAVGWTLMGIVVCCSLCTMVWTWWYRHRAVVRQSQPLFLSMTSLGTLVMATTILPLSLEDDDTLNLNAACMASPWVYLSGAIITFSALFAKTRGIYMAYKNPDLDRILVTPMDMFVTFSVLYGINLVILITWTVVSPLEWARIASGSTDRFEREVSFYGTCTSDNALGFVITILVINIGVLIVANYQAYQSRNIETEYNESRYIAISMAAFLQAWCMGIPICIVVWDKPQAKFFVQSGIVFVTSLSVLLLIYVPKIRAIRKEFNKRVRESRLQSFRDHQRTRRHSSTSFGVVDGESEMFESSERRRSSVASHWGLSITEPVNVRKNTISVTEIGSELDEVVAKEAQDEGKDNLNGVVSKAQSVEDDSEPVNGESIPKSKSADDVSMHAAATGAAAAVAPKSKSLEPPKSGGSSARGHFHHLSSPKSTSLRMKKRPNLKEALAGSFRMSGAIKSSDQTTLLDTGIRITHNPRSARNLELGHGQEISRAQKENIQEEMDQQQQQDHVVSGVISEEIIAEEPNDEEEAIQSDDPERLESAISSRDNNT